MKIANTFWRTLVYSSVATALLIASSVIAEAAKNVYDFVATSIDHKRVQLSEFRGNTLLIVNTASGCGFTPQYEGLQNLQNKYSARGFTVLAFPSNDFGQQEPGGDAQIKKFCELKYKVSFPLFSKGPVSGDSAQPVFRWLTREADPNTKGEIEWNFEKFLIDRNGALIARFKSQVTPEDPKLIQAIEASLSRS